MSSLFVFDFDRTIVDDDSDATIIRRLREKKTPPEWDTTNYDWTPYMRNVFELAFTAGMRPDDMLASIASMRPTPGAEQLIRTLAAHGWDVLIISDANTVFIKHWIKCHGLKDCVTDVITNHSVFQNGRLLIEPLMNQTACSHCPSNLCKSAALAQWTLGRQYTTIAYAGDGRNDYCPARILPETATVFPRKGYPLDKLVQATLSSPTPEIKAKVVPWIDCYRILEEIFPGETLIRNTD